MTSDEIKSVLIDAQNAGIMSDTHLTSISIGDKSLVMRRLQKYHESSELYDT
jgi:hypothetical protein